MRKRSILLFLLSAACCLLLASQVAFAATDTPPGKPYVRLDAEKAACLLVDHQTGLFSLVQDFEPAEFKNNVLALGAIAKLFKLPTVLSTSLEGGPNGPLLPELKEMLPGAPIIHRPGQINAWDSEEFVEAVEKTGRKQLLIAGIVTDVCVAHVALSAAEAGYDVFVVVDSSGAFNKTVRDASWDRMAANGVQLVNWFSVACELQRDWRNDMEGLANLFKQYLPAYGNLISSHGNAQNVQKEAAEKK